MINLRKKPAPFSRMIALLALLSTCLFSHLANAESNDSSQLKAVILLKALKYVQWPAQTLTNNTLRVCMVGKGPINRELKTLSGKKLSGKQVHVIYYEALKKTDLCHLAFINNSAAHQFHELIRLLATQPVLTVSDIPAFATNGGMFELNESKDRIRLVVNLKATRASGFLIGSQLLRMSRVIR
ncbi:YfiR family protein [Kistimonas asteriae]|uniref:YfiR family protein n=1 Tax=Kistimonas asteriae TaxID=517724 RepID=UPI001BAD256F|nr:YfiR family protein [Kistimonas asteriae]